METEEEVIESERLQAALSVERERAKKAECERDEYRPYYDAIRRNIQPAIERLIADREELLTAAKEYVNASFENKERLEKVIDKVIARGSTR